MYYKNIFLNKDTVSYNLLEIIAISGEIPVSLIKRMPGSESYKGSVITELKRLGLIKVYYRNSIRGLRLTNKAKKELLKSNAQRFTKIFSGNSDTNHIKSDIQRRCRLHRIAEATVTAVNSGCCIYRDEKPDIFSPFANRENDYKVISEAVFYNSREIKEMGTSFVKIKGARSVGVLLTAKDVFVVYNIGNALMKWNYKSEMRTKALMKTVLLREYNFGYSSESLKGLILADNMELCFEILSSESDKQYFLLDGNYDNFYYLTNDAKGERILSMLCNPATEDKFKRILLSDLIDGEESSLIENDAFEQDGTPVLFGFYCDLPRIKRFNTAILLQKKRGVIICFDYQKNALEKYCCEGITFKTVDFEKWEMKF